jgi:hypothetical protein
MEIDVQILCKISSFHSFIKKINHASTKQKNGEDKIIRKNIFLTIRKLWFEVSTAWFFWNQLFWVVVSHQLQLMKDNRRTVDNRTATPYNRRTVDNRTATPYNRRTVDNRTATSYNRRTVDNRTATPYNRRTVDNRTATPYNRRTVDNRTATTYNRRTVDNRTATPYNRRTVDNRTATPCIKFIRHCTLQFAA